MENMSTVSVAFAPTTASRVAVVTGSSRGVGRVFAEHLMQLGYHVHGCSRSAADWTSLSYSHSIVDLSDGDKALEWISQVIANAGRIDVLINNAAISKFCITFLNSIGAMKEMTQVNLLTPVLLCREVGLLMMKQKKGRIINISSIAVNMSAEGTGMYSATKSALEAFSKIFAKELALTGVRCNVLSISYFETEMAAQTSSRAKEHLSMFSTLKRDLQKEDITGALSHLVADTNSHLNGHVLHLGF